MEEMLKGRRDCDDYANCKTVGQANDIRDCVCHLAWTLSESMASSRHAYVIRIALTGCQGRLIVRLSETLLIGIGLLHRILLYGLETMPIGSLCVMQRWPGPRKRQSFWTRLGRRGVEIIESETIGKCTEKVENRIDKEFKTLVPVAIRACPAESRSTCAFYS